MNVTVQLGRIADAKGIRPGHAAYLKKDQMADIAQSLLDQHGKALHVAEDSLRACANTRDALVRARDQMTDHDGEAVASAWYDREIRDVEEVLRKAEGGPVTETVKGRC